MRCQLLALVIVALLCCTPRAAAVNAFTPWGDGKASFFQCVSFANDDQYARYDVQTGTFDQGLAPVLGNWPGWPVKWLGNVEAAVEWGNGKVYFFSRDSYLRYDIQDDVVDPGYPLPTRGNWPGWPADWDSVDAAVNWGNGIAYFFRGDEYLRYDIAADHVDPGYPWKIAGNWPGWPTDWYSVDAVARYPNGKVYFFRGGQYIRYDIATDQVDQGPRPIAGNWPGMPSNWASFGVRGGLNLNDQAIYFFGGVGEYARFNIAENIVDLGPLKLSDDWGWGYGWRTWPHRWSCPKATLNYGNGKLYVFSLGNYIRFDVRQNRVEFGPAPAIDYWPGWPASWVDADAAVYLGNHKALFFWRDEYLRYDTQLDRVDPGFPHKISADFPGWPATWNYVTAAMAYGDGKVYLFSTATGGVPIGPLNYLRLDLATLSVDPGFPKPVAGEFAWPAYYLNTGGALGGTLFPPYAVYLPLTPR